MATQAQTEYIIDLSIKKLKEYKEFKELLVSQNITTTDGDSITEIVNRLTDEQASKLIDALVARPEPDWQRRYSDKRIKQASDLLDEVIKEIEDWDFELR